MSDNESQKMTERTLKIRFNTPAFLGNATQNAQWRTPPFKALLRKWWRVVKAQSVDYNHLNLLKEENELFGKATDKEASRSKLMLRLDAWKAGEDFTQGKQTVKHPNVKGGMSINAQLYLGYGPVTVKVNKTALPANSSANLSLLFPEQYKSEIEETIKLIRAFGTIGSRSRNGWGSISIDGCELSFENIKNMAKKYGRKFDEAMKLEWAHCIGSDDKGPLIWKTAECSNFEDVMENLAKIKIGYRTAFEFDGGKFHKRPQKRHIIAYPVTNHDLDGMKNSRNPNQLIFKVLRAGDKYFGLIYHMPSKVSDDFFENKNLKADYRKNEKQVWEKVHTHLDARKELRRI